MGDQNCLQNGRPPGAIESTSRFGGASEIVAKATVLINLIALTFQTISLDHVLIYHAFGAAITIVHDDRKGYHRGGLRRQQRWLGGYCAAQYPPLPPAITPFTWRVPQHPPRKFIGGVYIELNMRCFRWERTRQS